MPWGGGSRRAIKVYQYFWVIWPKIPKASPQVTYFSIYFDDVVDKLKSQQSSDSGLKWQLTKADVSWHW